MLFNILVIWSGYFNVSSNLGYDITTGKMFILFLPIIEGATDTLHQFYAQVSLH
jgi:hypothetical protein